MKKIVISLGGSTVVSNGIQTDFILKFKNIIEDQKDSKFVVVVGGGDPCRVSNEAMKEKGLHKYLRSQIGVYHTYLNAALIASFFAKDPMKRILIPRNYDEFNKQYEEKDILFTGGIIPGSTTDSTAAEIAELVGADFFINITNVKGLYDKDPKTNPDAEFIKNISHDDFIQKFYSKLSDEPAQHFVIDKKAADIVSKNKIKVYILQGLDNLEKCLNNKEFLGTTIG